MEPEDEVEKNFERNERALSAACRACFSIPACWGSSVTQVRRSTGLRVLPYPDSMSLLLFCERCKAGMQALKELRKCHACSSSSPSETSCERCGDLVRVARSFSRRWFRSDALLQAKIDRIVVKSKANRVNVGESTPESITLEPIKTKAEEKPSVDLCGSQVDRIEAEIGKVTALERDDNISIKPVKIEVEERSSVDPCRSQVDGIEAEVGKVTTLERDDHITIEPVKIETDQCSDEDLIKGDNITIEPVKIEIDQHPDEDLTKGNAHNIFTFRGVACAKKDSASNAVANRERPFKCEACGEGFFYRSSLRRHLDDLAPLARTCECDYCGEIFDSRESLASHRHDAHKECRACDSSFRSFDALLRHDRLHHRTRPYECPKSVSTRIWQCDVCGKRSKSEKLLERHLRKHARKRRPTKRYACDSCNKTFSHRSNLVNHMWRHTGYKLYPCRFCPKRFTARSHLVLHTRLHTGEKPFQCDLCDKGYPQKIQLILHMKNHAKSVSPNRNGKSKRATRKRKLIEQ